MVKKKQLTREEVLYQCDITGCTNTPFKEVYWIGKKRKGVLTGWCYLCRKHFDEEKNNINKPFNCWAEPSECDENE